MVVETEPANQQPDIETLKALRAAAIGSATW
jgi:hypothetical protein